MEEKTLPQFQKPLTPRDVIEKKKNDAAQPFPGVQHWFNLQGFIKTTTTIPTLAPKSISDQLVIYIDDLATPTDKRLYVYSREANIWNYVTLT